MNFSVTIYKRALPISLFRPMLSGFTPHCYTVLLKQIPSYVIALNIESECKAAIQREQKKMNFHFVEREQARKRLNLCLGDFEMKNSFFQFPEKNSLFLKSVCKGNPKLHIHQIF